ncbi:MAG: hypothetical protein ACR2LJ_10405 [Acidimicrobiales bacterium]
MVLTLAGLANSGPALAKKPTTVPPPTTTTTVPSPTTTTTVPPPTTTTTTTIPPVAAPTNVVAYGALANDVGDDTTAFLRAQDAALASSVRYPSGPGGSPQAVVYVPPGTYKLLRLAFRSNIRMEVDAGAVLEQFGGRHVDVSSSAPALIVWDGLPGAALSNVTLIGVNTSAGGLKSMADPVFGGWSLDSSFTFDLEPATTDSSTLVTGLQALNVSGFLIQNVFSIENDSQPAVAATTDDGWWPQTRKAALGLRERADAPADGSAYYDPHNGVVVNWYNVGGPKGFGPNQVNAAHDVRFSHLFSSGGTAMRFETDASQGKSFASEIRGVTADDIAGRDCNRAVSFTPHAQNNYDVHVTHVQAVGCAQGVLESVDGTNTLPPGAFINSTISDVTVTAGTRAQVGLVGTGGMWTSSQSDRAFAKDKALQALWSVVYNAGTYRCSGSFSSPSDPVMTTAGRLLPVCT